MTMRLLATPFKRLRSDRQGGSAVVEFALILTLMMTLVAGIFEIGRAFWYYDALTKATRDAARLMSVTSKTLIASTGVADAKQVVVDAVVSAGVPDFTTPNVRVTCLTITFIDTVCTDNVAPGGVRVEITGYTLMIGKFIPFLLGSSRSYSAVLVPHTTMRYML
ncbi:MAG: Flp pilus assembly protein TadG [Burkholderiaceae bacterium]|jgi:Flp pilus assembly protein TadG